MLNGDPISLHSPSDHYWMYKLNVPHKEASDCSAIEPQPMSKLEITTWLHLEVLKRKKKGGGGQWHQLPPWNQQHTFSSYPMTVSKW